MTQEIEEREELALETVSDADVTMVNDVEESSMVATISFPGYDELDDRKVLRSVQDVFKKFDYGDTTNISNQFKDTDSLAVYAKNTMADIRAVRSKADINQLVHQAAAMSRFWYLGDTIDKALKAGSYGANAAHKLAVAWNMSDPYIYQIRAVATRLTPVDCYLLGIRGLDSTHLRKLAQVQDDATRKAIITTFVSACHDTSDPTKIMQAKKLFIAAINIKKALSTIDATTTNPDGDKVNDEDLPQEYVAVLNQISQWGKKLKKVMDEHSLEELFNASGNFYMPASAQDAETRLNDVKEAAESLKRVCMNTRNELDDIIREMDSLALVELNTDADALP